MHTTPGFSDLLRLIDERSAAFRAAVAAAPDLGAQVPTCPDWTLADLVRHIGDGRRTWAATVAAGPADAKAAPEPVPMPEGRDDLLGWLEDATRELLDALEAAGPDRECWGFWTTAPRTAGVVARRQLHEVAAHTYDAQVTIGAPQPVPAEIAVDGVDEFLRMFNTTTDPWPHEPETIRFEAAGRSWWLRLDGEGARLVPRRDASVEAVGTAHDLMLVLYGRLGLDVLEVRGDRGVLERLAAW
ncbi:TIGR03083 family protein [Lentzea fradiae]|uniref:TIGR03083 family protein n=1 Tax=Lentzea fradiae TaxID=200378 RepID=A0A1G7X457_9PSEU|nr:maleylpyruvate isomerase family mycothiol-dependent enzyme [Lentzea fradiae]SDG78988.1 TIGR03083 family protein [Lentzea fradiae]